MMKMMKTKKKERERRRNVYTRKLPESIDALGVSRGFKIKTHTHLSNHVQSDNKDFVCASGSLFIIFTCPLISKSVFISSPP
jgi:hypothetical protein